MPNPNILPIPAEFPYVSSYSKTWWGEKEMRRIAFRCGQFAVAWPELATGVMVNHPANCPTCRNADFLVEAVKALKAKGYTREQVLEAMEDVK